MRRMLVLVLSVVMLFGALPAISLSAAPLNTEQKYNFLVKEGIFTGYADGSSRLNESMTREQFAAVIFRLWDLRKEPAVPAYSDVLKIRWSFGEIQAVTKAGLMSGTGKRKFSPSAYVTVEQLAAVLVRAYGVSGTAASPVYGSVSAWAKADVGVALHKGWIPEQADYRMSAIRAILVEAAYAVFIDMNPLKDPERTKPDIASVKALSGNIVQIDLRSSVNAVSKDQFRIINDKGQDVIIAAVSLSEGGKRVTLITVNQEAGKVYYVAVDGKSWAYLTFSGDTSKPYIVSSTITAEAKIELIFNEEVDRSTAENKANYAIDKRLGITGVSLSADKKKVTIATEKQTAGTVYTLTVRNVKDLAGNVMEPRTNLYFGAVVDNAGPRVIKLAVEENKIVLSFSERLNAGSAERTSSYVMDGGLGIPVKAVYNDNNLTVTLTTTNQVTGRAYKLILNGITDRAGNPIGPNLTLPFTGLGDSRNPAIVLQSVSAVSNNELDIAFQQSLNGISLSSLKADIVSDNGSPVSISGWSAYIARKPADERTVRVQFRTSDNGNPDLFKQGHVYGVVVSGLPGLAVGGDANKKLFAGINAPNPGPYVTRVVPVNDRTVKVYFNEPVKNISPASFVLTDTEGRQVAVTSDQLNDRNRIVTEVNLNLGTGLDANTWYVMTFRTGVTDAAGWNGIRMVENNEPYKITFKGIG